MSYFHLPFPKEGEAKMPNKMVAQAIKQVNVQDNSFEMESLQLKDFSDEKLKTDLFTIKNLAKKHENFLNENKIRWLIYKDPPGLQNCLVRVSNRIFISEIRFLSFLNNYESQKEGN